MIEREETGGLLILGKGILQHKDWSQCTSALPIADVSMELNQADTFPLAQPRLGSGETTVKRCSAKIKLCLHMINEWLAIVPG